MFPYTVPSRKKRPCFSSDRIHPITLRPTPKCPAACPGGADDLFVCTNEVSKRDLPKPFSLSRRHALNALLRPVSSNYPCSPNQPAPHPEMPCRFRQCLVRRDNLYFVGDSMKRRALLPGSARHAKVHCSSGLKETKPQNRCSPGNGSRRHKGGPQP